MTYRAVLLSLFVTSALAGGVLTARAADITTDILATPASNLAIEASTQAAPASLIPGGAFKAVKAAQPPAPVPAVVIKQAAAIAPAAGGDTAASILGAPATTGDISDVSHPLPEDQKPQIAPVSAEVPAHVLAPAMATATPVQADALQKPQPLPTQIADDMADILSRAYAESPTLRAEREALRQQYENIVQAEAYKRPSISVSAGATATAAKTKPGTSDTYVTKDAGLSATQYIYRGGRTLAEVDQQIRLSEAAQASYDSAVQSAMLAVVTAAMDIRRDRATIELTEKNREVIAKQLEAAKRGFEVGELTRTDVAQAQARLSGADADLVAARAGYAASLERYKQYAGMDGNELGSAIPDAQIALPESREAAQSEAETGHPDIRAARLAGQAAEKAVDVAEGALLPEVSLSGDLSQAWDPTAALDESRSASVGVRATMPIYEGGSTRSQIRQAKLGQYEQRNRVEEAVRAVRKSVATAWDSYQAALSAIEAYKTQVDAATLARDGVYKEREVGVRTVLDTLNADAELLDAQVGLVKARRDAAVAAYTLAAATGGLTGQKLGFSGPDDGATDIQSARTAHFSTSIEPLATP